MSDIDEHDVPSPRECFANTARLLRNAEMETDRQVAGQLDDFARTWMALGSQVLELEEERL